VVEEPTYKKGHVLYQIPKKMQLLKETTCRIRIAFDNEKREYNKIIHALQFLIDELREKDLA
jgi:hypothetical protein